MDKLRLVELCSNRHWCPKSETFTGGDSLLTAIDNGWTVHPDVLIRTYRLRSSCLTTVYSFYLQRADSVALMNIVANPYVEAFIKEQHLITHCQDKRQRSFSYFRSRRDLLRQKEVQYS